MSSTKDSNTISLVAVSIVTIVTTVIVTAYTTYTITQKIEKEKQKEIRYRDYQREQLLKKKTAEARVKLGNTVPKYGTLLNDLKLDSVYLLECEDLRKKFPSLQKIENVMKFRSTVVTGGIARSPLLRSSTTDLKKLETSTEHATNYNKLITDHECVLADIVRKPNKETYTNAYVRAGARRFLHFDPKTVNAAIVTCGGLCPGLNNVIREITKTLHQLYDIGGNVYGIQGGFRGFYDFESLPPVILTPEMVEDIHHQGGTCLGSSRGGFDLQKIIAFIEDKKINQLYVIGGDGTHRGYVLLKQRKDTIVNCKLCKFFIVLYSLLFVFIQFRILYHNSAFVIHEGCMERGLNVSVAGIPKTIDNDVDLIDYSFGFNSAVEAACLSIRSAKTEAVCNLPNGIGIVKLMGRSAGFIAAHATMASSDVDLCLVPEVPVVLEGEFGNLNHLRRRVKEQGYAVVVVAEGAGEEVVGTSAEVDASGNKKLPPIGLFMKDAIEEYFKRFNETATVKYIDPSYTVRSVPANASDSLYCMQLAQNAVHGAMAGYTGFTVGLCNNRMCFIPIPELVDTSPRSMDPRGRTWERVLALTRQPNTVKSLNPGEKAYQQHEPTLR